MPQVTSAIAEGNDAIELCADQLRGCGDLTLCFATSSLQPRFEAGLGAFDSPVFGCSAFGVLGGDREIEGSPAAAALAIRGLSLDGFTLDLNDAGAAAGHELGRRWPGDGVAALLFPDAASFNGDIFFREFRRSHGFAPLVGGLSAGTPQGSLFCGDRVASGAVSGLLLRGGLTCELLVTQCCDPMTEIRTVSSAEGNVIHKLDSDAAMEVLKEALQASPEAGHAARTGNIFGGFLLDDRKPESGRGDFLIRALVGADQESGTVSVAGPVHVGDRFAFLYRNDRIATEDFNRRLAELKARLDGAPILFGLYFNCAGRGRSLYGADSVDVGLIRRHLGEFPLAGFHGNGEIAPSARRNVLHNFTGVLALFR